MNQKDMGTQECIKGVPGECNPHMGHHEHCGRYNDGRGNTAQQNAMRASMSASMGGVPAPMGGMGGMPGMGGGIPGMLPGGVGMPLPQTPQRPQHVGVDVMGQWGQGMGQQAQGGPPGGAWGGQPALPALGPGGGGYANGHANGANGSAASGSQSSRAERFERASLAIVCAMIGKMTAEEFQANAGTVVLDSVRAARALIDEIDSITRMGAGS